MVHIAVVIPQIALMRMCLMQAKRVVLAYMSGEIIAAQKLFSPALHNAHTRVNVRP
jgi:hypothetical protein